MSKYINSEHDRVTVPVEFKFVKADDGDDDEGGGIIEGHASVFNNIDLGGDIVLPGAFKKTIKDRVKRGMVKLLSNHDMWDLKAILGTVIFAKEDDTGLFFRAKLSKALSVQEIRLKMTEGHIDKLSFGFDILKHRFEDIKGRTIRMLEELKLWEISVVGFPMNERASIESVKSIPIPYQDLPVAPKDTHWDADGAGVRIRQWTGESQKSTIAYLEIDRDSGSPNSKTLIADVIEGQLVVIPAAVMQLAENIEQDDSLAHLAGHLDKYINKITNKLDSKTKPETPLSEDGKHKPESAEPDIPLTVDAQLKLLELRKLQNNYRLEKI